MDLLNFDNAPSQTEANPSSSGNALDFFNNGQDKGQLGQMAAN
jgi:hypothetical protein